MISGLTNVGLLFHENVHTETADVRFGHLLREGASGPGLLVYWPTDDLDAGDLWAPVIRMTCGGKYRKWVLDPVSTAGNNQSFGVNPSSAHPSAGDSVSPPFWNAIMFAAIRVHESGHQYGEEAESTSE